MPPRRSARLAPAVAPDNSALLALPPALVLAIFSLLPVDARACCAAVCRAWRAALSDTALWRHLDLSLTCGVARPLTDALLQAAAARAGGTLRALDLSGFPAASAAALLAVVTANAGALQLLRLGDPSPELPLWELPRFEALLRAAPQLRISDAAVTCHAVATARRMLRNEDIYERLRLRQLVLWQLGGDALRGEVDVLDFAAAVRSHASLTFLQLVNCVLDTAVKMDAIADAVEALQMTALWLNDCTLTRACAPALVRLCASGTLTELGLCGDGSVLEDVATALVIADRLRTNTLLTEVILESLGIWRDATVGAAILGALTGHRSIRFLHLSCLDVPPEHEEAAGAALGALVAANAPALQELRVSNSELGDVGLGPLVDALPLNTHLLKLVLFEAEEPAMSEAFARDRLLPAVRANTSLSELETNSSGLEGAVEAERLVRERDAASDVSE